MVDDAQKDPPKEVEHKIFVGGIPYRMGEAELRDLFGKYNAEQGVILLDKVTQKPRGFGFVTFRDRESMLDAIRDMHNKDVDGKPISVKEAIPQDQIKPGTPASAIGRGGYGREGGGRFERYPDRRGYDRGGGADRYGSGGYDRGSYDRYGGGGGGGYDPRSGGYDPRSYDRGYYGGGGGGYERDPYYRDPYARDPYAAPAYGGQGGAAYDSRYQSAGYDSRYPDYSADDRYRSAGGPDRGRYPPPAARGPYDRPDARRDVRR